MATDRYARTVAIIYADKTLLNEELVKADLAWVYDFYCSEPICESWEKFQLGVRFDKRGLGADDDLLAPWEFWRKKSRKRGEVMSKKNYSLTVVLAFVGGLVGGVVSNQLLLGPPAHAERNATSLKVIQAEEFRVVDKDGRKRAQLMLTDLGSPALTLRDKNELIRIHMQLVPEGFPVLWFRDENGLLKASLTLLPRGDLSLRLGVKESIVQENAAEIFVGKSGGNLALYDGNGKLRTILGSTTFKEQKRGRIIKRPLSSLVLFNEIGDVVLQTP
jgi:hypothetical protein